jgi:hypothetical protein
MDKVQKPINSECYTPSSEPIGTNLLPCFMHGLIDWSILSLLNKHFNGDIRGLFQGGIPKFSWSSSEDYEDQLGQPLVGPDLNPVL